MIERGGSNMTLRLRITAVGSLWGLLSLPALSQNVSIEVQPGSITASSSNFTAEARVILKNPSEERLRKISLGWFSNDGIKAELGKPRATVACPKREIVWPVKISVSGKSHMPGAVIFEASYVARSDVKHLYASLALQGDSAQKLVEASLEGNPEAVSQQRPGAIYVLVTNNIDVPVEVSVGSQVPSKAVQIVGGDPFQVPPRSSAAHKVEIQAASRVTPGVHPVVIEVNASWERAGQKEERHFALTKSVTVGVFFESELLKALSIPSFLVLPGCLVIFTMQLMLSFGVFGLKDVSKLPEIGITSPAFWILAVTFSGLFAPAYYCATGVNYLLNYGGDDLRNVWLMSIGIGVGFYLIIAGATLRHRREHVPSISDSPATVLKKLAKNGLGIVLPQVKYKLNNLELGGFVIEKIQDGQTLVWVAPHITTEWQNNAQAQGLKKQFDDIVNGSRDPAALAEVLEHARDVVTLRFESKGGVPNPYHVQVEAITQYLPAGLIVG